jgi:DNA polymerase kappa
LQFFEPLQDQSPRKKPKQNADGIEHGVEIDDSGDLEPHDTPEEAMPGFYEHEDEAIEHDNDSDLVDPQPPPYPPRRQFSILKPVSESKASDFAKTSMFSACSSAKPHSSTGVPPKSLIPDSGSRQNLPSESLTCPICEKVLQTDNQGFNSHIDFCLSRGVIRQAHAEASSPVKRNSKSSQQKNQK